MIEIKKIWLTPTEIWVQTAYGIHWEHLDEDLCFEVFFQPKAAR